MKTKELELKDISGNLPYELFCEFTDRKTGRKIIRKARNVRTEKDCATSCRVSINEYSIELVKPILYPLDTMYKTIIHNCKEIVPIVKLAKIVGINTNNYKIEIYPKRVLTKEYCFGFDKSGFYLLVRKSGNMLFYDDQYQLFDYLHELKIDYRGLIDTGLAIDVNTLKENPYK